jgi:hypothetical protein
MPANSLAAAIAGAKLKKTPGRDDKAGDTGSTGSDTGSIGGNNNRPVGGMASMMDEMAKTLARRRAQAEGGSDNKWDSKVNGSSPSKDNTDGASSRLVQNASFTFVFLCLANGVCRIHVIVSTVLLFCSKMSTVERDAVIRDDALD